MTPIDNQAAQEQLAALLAELKGVRRRRGDMPQELLATRLDVVTNSVADWEASRDNPSAPHLMLWSRELGLRVAIMDSEGHEISVPADAVATQEDSGDFHAQRELARLSAALRTARTRQGLPQTALAETLRVNLRSITRWESAHGYPRPLGFVLWAGALECNVRLLPA